MLSQNNSRHWIKKSIRKFNSCLTDRIFLFLAEMKTVILLLLAFNMVLVLSAPIGDYGGETFFSSNTFSKSF